MPNSANKDDRGQEAHQPGQGTGKQDGPAAPSLARRAMLFGAIALTGLLADLISKEWVFRRFWPNAPLPPLGASRTSVAHSLNLFLRDHGQPHWIWEPYLGFELSLNEGALFGFGQGYVWFFATVSLLAVAFILYFLFKRGEARDLWLCVAFGFVLGGILGNLYDRLGLSFVPGSNPPQRISAVRDWILFQVGTFHWPNFNIADSLLVCGACMLLLQVFFRSPREKKGDGAVLQRSGAESSAA